MPAPIRIGLAGVGHLGTIHLRNLLKIPEVTVSGVFDVDPERLARARQAFDVPAFDSFDALLAHSDAVDIVTPTTSHYVLARQALEAGRHVFIEKPVTETVEEARRLLDLARQAECIVQVGHVERFNPAVRAVIERHPLRPRYLEAHRLTPFGGRGTDVSVVLDLMIHDIDLALWWTASPVKEIRARGVAVMTALPDIASARIEFENGAVANLTASRISLKKERKVRLFQHSQYVSLDLLHHKAALYQLVDDTPEARTRHPLHRPMGHRLVVAEFPEVPQLNAIQEELRTFARAIQQHTPPPVTLSEAYHSLKIAHEVMEEVLAHLD